MPHPPRPHGQVTPALDELNDRIRRLMDQPPSAERTAAYERLLRQWADARQPASFVTAA
ncbi:hypothetical protein OG800_48835 [Streptomyces sp. NBC_00445]|uniref:hypothetical protein n=1 Tax=Streptomyces sp. NBC_00445 TaxID=2975745 RepID=UPI002E1EAA44